MAVAGPAGSQTFVTPTANTNIIGVTPDPANIRDLGLKQQQEPSCIVRPDNPAFIFCAYNDLRAADQALVQGDSWMGVSMSNDFGQTWFSRLAPGYKSHPNSLGMGFAADPSVVAIPGNSPGLAVLNYIAAFRDSDAGVFAVQRWVEFPREDQDFWKPENEIYIIADGSEGRFIDKPAFFFLPDELSQQGTFTEEINIEGESEPITVTTPTGTLIAIAAVFTGNQGGAKILMWKSFDNGKTWTNSEKISEEQNEVTGVSIAAKGQDFVVVYRRKGDSNNTDAILSAFCSLSGNQRCSKGEVVYEICPFDQPASGTTFRTFSFPWAASDGDRFWAFAASRNPGAACVESPTVPGIFEGKPRIVAMSSVDGKTWVGAPGATDVPFEIVPRAEGFQAIPAALGTKGRVDVAWYDTFREEDIGLPTGPNDLLINDYVAGGGLARVWRKADVWMTRLDGSGCGGGPNSGCLPSIEPPVRVSRYETVADSAGSVFEIEGHLTGMPLYGSGTLAFKGDYIALATRLLRQAANGKWLPNYLPQQASDLATYTDQEDIFVAWGDNRDVRADDYPIVVNGVGGAPNLDPGNQQPYSPPGNSPAAKAVPSGPDEDGPSSDRHRAVMVAEDEPDDSLTQPSDIQVCLAGQDFSRARDANVYGSLVRDEASLVATTESKPLNTIQRMFPLVLTNIDPANPKDFCLHIATQPLDYPAGPPPVEGNGLASFFQLPSKAPFEQGDEVAFLDVTVPGGSSASRAAYITTNQVASIVTINAYQGTCPAPSPSPTFNGPLISSVDLSNGDLVDPEFCEDPANAGNRFCQPVSNTETHDIAFAAPVLQTPVLQTPTFQTPTFQTPTFQTPTFQTPTFQTPTFQTPTFQTPTFQTPTLQTASLVGDATFTTDTMEAPTLQTDTFADTATTNPSQVYFQDVTYPVEAAANVTTTYSADILISDELDRDTSEVQLIAWAPNVHATTGGCFAQPAADQQIIAYTQVSDADLSALTLPFTISEDQQEPYRGEISFFGQPDRDISVTVRIWAVDNGDPSTTSALVTLQQREADRQACLAGLGDNPLPDDVLACEALGARGLITFGASSHSCITQDADDKTENPTPFDCLNNGNEKILEDRIGPQISFSIDTELEATGPDGAAVSYTATATDNVDPSPTLSCVPASGTVFGLGLNTVSCFAEDSAVPPNTTVASFDVVIVDTTQPVLTVPGDVTANATGPQTAVDIGTALATDLVDADVILVNDAPATFPLGATTVTWTATDASGNVAEATQVVTVNDTTAPVITPPATVTVLARDAADVDVTYTLVGNSATVEANLPPPDGARITYAPTAIDAVTGAVSVSCDPAPGSIFTEGTASVLCSAVDTTGNSASLGLSFTIIDTTDPVFSVANGTVYSFEADRPGGAFVDLVQGRGLVATDRGVTLEPDCAATPSGGGVPIDLPALLAPGDYDVTCVVDGVTTTFVTVTVVVDIDDNEPPVLTIPAATATVSADPVTRIANVDLLGPIFDTDGDGLGDAAISATDVVDPDVAIACDPPSGNFDVGRYVIRCTASDDGPNASGEANTVTESFTLDVVFPYGIELIVPKGNIKAGSTIPIDWIYLDRLGNPVASADVDPMVRWNGRYADNDSECALGSTNGTEGAEDSGSSAIRYSPSNATWQLSWQTPDQPGRYKLTVIPPGEDVPEANFCVRLR